MADATAIVASCKAGIPSSDTKKNRAWTQRNDAAAGPAELAQHAEGRPGKNSAKDRSGGVAKQHSDSRYRWAHRRWVEWLEDDPTPAMSRQASRKRRRDAGPLLSIDRTQRCPQRLGRCDPTVRATPPLQFLADYCSSEFPFRPNALFSSGFLVAPRLTNIRSAQRRTP